MNWLKKQDPTTVRTLPYREYMIYLRHHGFPSPFLDWTQSPYIAAYFSFQDVSDDDPSPVAIYAYLEPPGAKGGHDTGPFISVLQSKAKLTQRHFLQQSTYTICTEGKGEELRYCNHMKVFDELESPGQKKQQAFAWKITLPSRERGEAIRNLARLNINAYVLFLSEESLMRTVYLEDLYQIG